MGDPTVATRGCQVVLSFDVEEHFRIEAAVGLAIAPELQAHYRSRLRPTIGLLLDELARADQRATFFVVGEIARHSPDLVKAIHQAGHEVASHSWEHKRVHVLDPKSFRLDLKLSKDALEQVTGTAVVGFRAPTFSICRQTAWAIDVLAEEGFLYDSSIYPVRHDRYGVPDAPREPFMARGVVHRILELPPATWRLLGVNVPVGGGGYFRLFPLGVMEAGVEQLSQRTPPMLYFHPWEFDPRQRRLPLGHVSSLRTYCGSFRSRENLRRLLRKHRGVTAKELANRIASSTNAEFDLTFVQRRVCNNTSLSGSSATV